MWSGMHRHVGYVARAGICAAVLIDLRACGWGFVTNPTTWSKGLGVHSGWSSRGGHHAAKSRLNVGSRLRNEAGTTVMQVWSNPQAIKDYQDLLGGNAPEEKVDGPSVIVGVGKLGTALVELGGGDDILVRRGETIPETISVDRGGLGSREDGDGDRVELSEFPIYVCVKEDDVADVIDSCPVDKRQDLVFLQGGCLEPLLKTRSVCRPEQTQATLCVGIKSVGAKIQDYQRNIGTDVRGDPKFSGQTTVCGKWRGALAGRLAKGGLPCSQVFYLDWRRVMFEKLCFDCAIDLVGAVHGFEKTGYIRKYFEGELCDLLFELKNALRSTLAVTLLNGYEERVLSFAETVEGRPTAMDEAYFKWSNGFFYDITQSTRRVGFPDPCPMHTEYLEYGQHEGLFNF